VWPFRNLTAPEAFNEPTFSTPTAHPEPDRQTTFNPNQHGTYTVNADCTGTMHIVYDSGAVLDAQIAIADNGQVVKGIISNETVPSFAPVPGASCTAGCALGVQVSLEGQKTSDRNRDRDH
jgi:hypothetical protein